MIQKASPQSANYELLFSYFNEIGIISQLSGSLFERAFPDGLTASQFSVLNWFVRVDSVATPGRLAAAFQVTRGAMTNTLKKLSAKGLITIDTDPSNGRSKLVHMTKKGDTLRTRAIECTYPLMATFVEEFDMASISRQMKDIRAVRAFLDESRNG